MSLNMWRAGAASRIHFLPGTLLIALLVALLTACGPEPVASLSDREYIKKADALKESGHWSESINVLKQALIQNPSNTEARWILGTLYLDMGQGVAAEKELARAQELGLGWAAVGVALCRAWLLTGDTDSVLSATGSMDRFAKPLRASLLVERARALSELGRHVEAHKALMASLKLLPKYQRAWANLALLNLQLGDNESARWWARKLETAKKLAADEKLAWLQVAMSDGRLEEAFKAVEALRNTAHPRSLLYQQALKTSSLLAVLRGDDSAMNRDLAVISSREPRHELLVRSLWALRKDDFAQAQVSLESLLRQFPEAVEAQALLSFVHLAQRRWQQAERYAQLYLNRMPGGVAPGVVRAIALDAVAQTEMAVEQLARVQRGNPDQHLSAFLLGQFVFRERIREQDAGALFEVSDNHQWVADAFQGLKPIFLTQRWDTVAPRPTVIAGMSRMARNHPRVGPDELRELHGAMLRGDWNQAERRLQALQSQSGADQKLTALLATWAGVLQLQQGNQALALRAFEAVMDERPGHLFSGHYLASMHWSAGNIELARGVFEETGRENPGVSMPWVQLGTMELSLGRVDEASRAFATALDHELWSVQGETGQARIAGYAQGVFRKPQALSEKPSVRVVDLGELLAMLALVRGQPDEGLVWLQPALAHKADSAATRMLHVRLLVAQEDWDKATKALSESGPEQAGSIPLIELKARVARATGDDKELVRQLRDALRLRPEDLQIMLALQQYSKNAADQAKALSLVRKIQRDDSTATYSYVIEGDLLLQQGKLKEASTAYRTALSLAPDRVLALKLYEVLMSSDQGHAAVEVLERWVDWNSDDLEVRERLAQGLQSLGRFDESVRQWRLVLGRNPGNRLAILAVVEWDREQDPVSARGVLDDGLSQYPDDPDLLVLDGQMLVAGGDPQRGLARLERASRDHPGHPGLQWAVVQEKVRQGQNGSVSDLLGQLLKNHGEFDGRKAALALQQNLASKRPATPEADPN